MAQLPVLLPFIPWAGDLPVSSEDDVRAVLPDFAQGDPAGAPVREAIVSTILETQLQWELGSGYAAAQSDATRATDIYLDGYGEDYGFSRQEAEQDEVFRDRIFAVPAVVTPEAILAIATKILAPYSMVKPQLIESILDRWYVEDDTATWRAYVGPVDPDYPDRYYDDRVQAHPGGLWCFDDSTDGRMFVLRVPVLDYVDSDLAYVGNGSNLRSSEVDGTYSFFIGDGLNMNNVEADGTYSSFIFQDLSLSAAVIQSIIDAIEGIRGHGIRWMLWVDPALTS